MAQNHKTWEYPFATPNLDVQTDSRLLEPGRFAQLTGIDGREDGIIRRFPGFENLETIDLASAGYTGFSGATLSRFWSFALQLAPKSRTIVRGIIFVTTTTAGGEDVLVSYTMREKDGTVVEDGVKPIITLSGVDFDDLDVAADGQLLYITGRLDDNTPVEKLARYTLDGATGTWAQADWDFDWLSISDVQDHAALTNPPVGHLVSDQEGLVSYGITFRLVFPEQGYVLPVPDPFVWTPQISTTTSRRIWGYFANADLFRDATAVESLGNVFTDCRLQVFRTIANRKRSQQPDEDAADPEFAGRLFLEAEFIIPRHWSGSKRSYESNTQDGDGYITHITDNATSASLFAVGQTIYVTGYTRVDTSDATQRETTRVARFVYKRQIESLTDVGGDLKIELDRKIPSGPADVTDAGNYWVSDENETEDTTHQFDISFGPEGTIAADGTYMVTLGFKSGADNVLAADLVNDTPQGLSDAALTGQPELDTVDFSVFKDARVPVTRRIIEYDNLLVRVTEPRADGLSSSPIETVSWSFTDRPGKGMISVLTRRRITDLQRQIEAFVKAPPFLVVCLSNGFLRMYRSGDRMVVDDFHNRFGMEPGTKPLSIGTAVYVVSPHGLLVMDAASGEVSVIQNTAPYFRDTERWRNSLSNVQLGFDGEAGALVAYNTSNNEALLLWSATGRMTHLRDLPYDQIVSSPNLRQKGHEKLYWLLESTGELFEIDSDRSVGVIATVGVDAGSLGNITTSTSPNKLIDTNASFDSSLAGHFAFVQNPTTLVWSRTLITAVDSSTQLSLTDNIATTTGQQYALAVIPMEVQGWPLRLSQEDRLFDMFRLKRVSQMGLVVLRNDVALLSSESVEDVQYHVYSPYDDGDTVPATPAARSAVAFPATVNANADTFASIAYNGSVLMPGFSAYSCKKDVSFGGMIIKGVVDDTEIDQVNQSS